MEESTTITWQDFEKIDIRMGTVLKAEPFPKARKPAYQLLIDFGPHLGLRRSSAQITHHSCPATRNRPGPTTSSGPEIRASRPPRHSRPATVKAPGRPETSAPPGRQSPAPKPAT